MRCSTNSIEHHPKEPHYYLSLWATHPDHTGRGVGTALIRDDLERLDAEEMPAYLESTNPANLPRYEALGFDRRGELRTPRWSCYHHDVACGPR